MRNSLQSLQTLNLLVAFLPFLLLPLMGSLRPCDAKPRGDVCLFNNQRYQLGETFHPKVLPVEDQCVNCTCQQGGKVKCWSADCDVPDCENPVYVAGECCPVCNVEPEVPLAKVTPPPGCDYDGTHYEDAEEFPSNKTAFKPKHDQCVLCQCFKGRVYCHLKKCVLPPNCVKVVTVPHDCCQQCEEYLEEPDPPKTARIKPGDCLSSSNGPQKNGATWKPVVGQFGTMECVVCKCQNGRVDCNRVQCPTESSYKCKRPQLRKGKCCRECPKKRRPERKVKKNNKGAGGKKKCKKDKGGENRKKRKGKKKRKRCKNKKSHNKKSPPTQKTPVPSTPSSNHEDTLGNVTMAVAKDKLCVHKKAEYIVYLVRGDNSYSLILDNIKGNGKSEKTDWGFRKGFFVSTKTSPLLSDSPIRRTVSTANLAGTSIARNVKKFFKIVNRKLQKCKKRCRRKVLDKSFKRLRLKRVNLKKSC